MLVHGNGQGRVDHLEQLLLPGFLLQVLAALGKQIAWDAAHSRELGRRVDARRFLLALDPV